MQMSEPFAATVAAVAPVVWLVGAVEYHQVTKRAVEDMAAGAELMAQTVVDLQGATDAEVLDHRWTESQEQILRPPNRLLPLQFMWGLVTICLLYSMVVALDWLAVGDEEVKASGEAAFCYFTLCFSFVVVSVSPAIAGAKRMNGTLRQRAALIADIERLQDEARRRRGSLPPS
ncbi:hypothetical protein ACFVOR_16445 [Streptomyces sp. NPDC057837]|uniref:hypothetical protein n=1 Tax=Streptomyces sp. NPDC057837 TaxID=3346260 RepID=UPI0036845D06